MNTIAMVLAALVILLALGLVVWGWLTMAEVEQELTSFCKFEGLDFET